MAVIIIGVDNEPDFVEIAMNMGPDVVFFQEDQVSEDFSNFYFRNERDIICLYTTTTIEQMKKKLKKFRFVVGKCAEIDEALAKIH